MNDSFRSAADNLNLRWEHSSFRNAENRFRNFELLGYLCRNKSCEYRTNAEFTETILAPRLDRSPRIWITSYYQGRSTSGRDGKDAANSRYKSRRVMRKCIVRAQSELAGAIAAKYPDCSIGYHDDRVYASGSHCLSKQ